MSAVAVPAIPIGLPYTIRLEVEGAGVFFPAGATYTSHVRADAGSAILAALTSATGGLVRVSDTELDIVFTAEQTAALTEGQVLLDWVRTDTDPDQYGGYLLTLPTFRPITRLV